VRGGACCSARGVIEVSVLTTSEVASSSRRAALQESSFREFCSRPENKGMVQKTQKAEVKKVQQAEEQMRALKFRDVVLAAEPQAQKAVAPFLQVPILRRVVQTMANDERGDFTAWATNPLVLEYLGLAKKALDEGLMTEAEAEHLMLAQIKVRGGRTGRPCLLARPSISELTRPARGAGPEVEPGRGGVQGPHAAQGSTGHGAAGGRTQRAAAGAQRRQHGISRQAIRPGHGCVPPVHQTHER